MTVSGAVWFLVGGILGGLFGYLAAFNVALARQYSDKIDYYELDPIEINTPSYREMEEYEDYNFDF